MAERKREYAIVSRGLRDNKISPIIPANICDKQSRCGSHYTFPAPHLGLTPLLCRLLFRMLFVAGALGTRALYTPRAELIIGNAFVLSWLFTS